MKKISLLVLTLCFMSKSSLEAKFSLKSIIPGLGHIVNHAPQIFTNNTTLAFFLQFLPHQAFWLSREQAIRVAETMEDHSELDLRKISVEHDPVVFPESKEMVTVYADYKPEHNAENRLDKAKELRNWHAKVALALAALAKFTPAPEEAPGICIDPIADIVKNTALKMPTYLAGLNAGYAGYKTWQAYDLGAKIKQAQNGDGDMARALERKAIAYQVQDIE